MILLGRRWSVRVPGNKRAGPGFAAKKGSNGVVLVDVKGNRITGVIEIRLWAVCPCGGQLAVCKGSKGRQTHRPLL
jgi:hypothetical protein